MEIICFKFTQTAKRTNDQVYLAKILITLLERKKRIDHGLNNNQILSEKSSEQMN